MGFMKEFKEFLEEYKIWGLAIALMIGLAANQMVKSLVDNIIMPAITFFIPDGEWKQATFSLGEIVFSWGQFLADVIYFIIIAMVVFLIAKLLLKETKVTKK